MNQTLRLDPYVMEDDEAYWATLISGLQLELRAWKRTHPEVVLAGEKIAASSNQLDPRALKNARDWYQMHHAYQRQARQLTSAMTEASSIADSYGSMEEFWRDAEAQAKGESTGTFWDVYEHGGRRLLEQKLAVACDAEDAILVNSGMSSLAVALEAMCAGGPRRIVTTGNIYFETNDLLNRVYVSRGVDVLDSSLRQSGAGATTGALLLIETANSSPTGPRYLDDLLEESILNDIPIICDNSAVSVQARWGEIMASSAKLVCVESTAKFLARNALGGIIYGRRDAIDNMRHIARSTGQNLQAAAFHNIRVGEIDAIGMRMRLHARNVTTVLQQLQDTSDFLELCCAPRSNFKRVLRGDFGATVLFLRARETRTTDKATLHRRILDRWRALAAARGLSVEIRAGYGWDMTTARCYEGKTLKHVAIDDYMRVSVGIEPTHVANAIGESLKVAIREVCNG